MSPSLTSSSYKFDVSSTYGDRDKFDFKVAESGCIIAKISSWTPSGSNKTPATSLALILNGSDRTGYYARADGTTTSIVPLWISYAVKIDEINKVKNWTISVANFTKKNSAKGTLSLEYPPANTPCQLKIATTKTKGKLDITWVYTGKPFRGSFLVERTTNGKTWSVIRGCTSKAPTSTANSTGYSCSDTGLGSGSTYYYRACSITSGNKCDEKKYITPAIAVRVP